MPNPTQQPFLWCLLDLFMDVAVAIGISPLARTILLCKTILCWEDDTDQLMIRNDYFMYLLFLAVILVHFYKGYVPLLSI